MKLDVYTHTVPPKFIDAVEKLTPFGPIIRSYATRCSTTNDWEHRFRIMDKYGDYMQVLTVNSTYHVMSGDKAAELAKIANNEVAELISRYPGRFIAGVATLPMNDMELALMEIDRAINELNLRGVMIWASPNATPIDSPKFMPLYKKMSQHDLLFGFILSEQLRPQTIPAKANQSITYTVHSAGLMKLRLPWPDWYLVRC